MTEQTTPPAADVAPARFQVRMDVEEWGTLAADVIDTRDGRSQIVTVDGKPLLHTLDATLLADTLNRFAASLDGTHRAAVTVTDQVRVTGQPNPHPVTGTRFPPYEFVWTDEIARAHIESGKTTYLDGVEPTAEAAARAFCTVGDKMMSWDDGPHLDRRVVVTTDWERFK